MISYSPGMRLEIRGEEWKVNKVERNSMGTQTLMLVGISALVQDIEAQFVADPNLEFGHKLTEVVKVINPAETQLVLDTSADFTRGKLYIESQLRQKVPTDAKLHIGNRAAMDPLPFQLEPTSMALGAQRQRLLIADTVGLGKTLEAGILLSELILRGRARRILVVTVKSMMTQFQKELWNRFTIPLIRLDSARIQKIRRDLPENYNPFNYYDKTIVSVDTLKQNVEYRVHLEEAYWDVIVIDEAHNVATRGKGRSQSQRSRLAQLLAGRSDALILLSATPHDGSRESFASLMQMLDPTAIVNPEAYTKEDIRGLFVRRLKKDVKNQFQAKYMEREVHMERCQATPEEEAVFDYFTDMHLEMDEKKSVRDGLFKISLEKALFSSPQACKVSLTVRLKKLAKKNTESSAKDSVALQGLKELVEKVTPEHCSRYQRLLDLLNSPAYGWDRKKKNDRVVIFTERIETMNFLADQLRHDLHLPEGAIQALYGQMSDKEQQDAVEKFGRSESPVRLLVASDVASEGINLHHACHRLIHFDIPWSLMVFQQRNGRIDRYGQEQRPDIRYLVTDSANEKMHGDARILEVLIEKEKQANENIGDPTMLMGQYTVEGEEMMTGTAMQEGKSAEDFSAELGANEDEEDDWEDLLSDDDERDNVPETVKEQTLYGDMAYLSTELREAQIPFSNMPGAEGIEIDVDKTDSRMRKILPEEAIPRDRLLRFSPSKQVCIDQMKDSLRNSLDENTWPLVQYLWPLHPIFSWVNDKAQILYGRREAPLLGLHGKLQPGEAIVLASASVPNRKAMTVIDDWQGLLFHDGQFKQALTLEECWQRTGLRAENLSNVGEMMPGQLEKLQQLVPLAVDEMEKISSQHRHAYMQDIQPEIDAQLDRLGNLQNKHHEYIQLSLFADAKSQKKQVERQEELDRIDRKINEYGSWVEDTLYIEDHAYIKIIAVLAEVE